MGHMIIEEIGEEYKVYLKDESRKVGSAESISFPQTEDQVQEVLKTICDKKTSITLQGGRTGITAGAVPSGGHILNLSRMNKITGLRYDSDSDSFFVSVQPGVLLSDLRKSLENCCFSTEQWSEEAKRLAEKFKDTGPWFFPPDPTEASASIGGMVACNASGARSFFYGPTRNYIEALRLVLYDGSILKLKRGVNRLKNRSFSIELDTGRKIHGSVPSYKMPDIKNASGYYAKDNMDLIDLFIGSEGTLGVITEIELLLKKAPKCIWGVMAFFPSEEDAVSFVRAVRGEKIEDLNTNVSSKPAAIEYFNSKALDLLRHQKENNPAFSEIPDMPDNFHTAIYIEYHADNEDEIENLVLEAAELLELCRGSEETTWMATNSKELERMKFFRHAVPEAVNLLIDERRKKNPDITKLGTDMAVPDKWLDKILELYNRDLAKNNLDSVMFGHIGNNHIHVNILPKDMGDYDRGKGLYVKWAREVIRLGGTVSAEHGIGKLKTEFLKEMYGQEGIEQMRTVKELFDPYNMLNRGNLFG